MHVTRDEVQRIYRRRFSELDKAAKAAVWKVVVEGFLQRWVEPADTVVDLGCGHGEFLNFVRCARRIGVDLNPDSREHLSDGIEFHSESVCSLPFLEDGMADVVFTSNLMEHLPGKREVAAMISEAARILKPGGTFIALGPNARILPGVYWDYWDHVVALTDRSVEELLENSGFQIANCYPRFLPYTIRSPLPKSPLLVAMYLRCRPMWWILGGQFLIRARKLEQKGPQAD